MARKISQLDSDTTPVDTDTLVGTNAANGAARQFSVASLRRSVASGGLESIAFGDDGSIAETHADGTVITTTFDGATIAQAYSVAIDNDGNDTVTYTFADDGTITVGRT